MYSPKHYDTHEQVLIERIVRENQFATLIAGDEISHLPLLLEKDRLVGHMARANPQWERFPQKVTAVFSGPHAYISPAWYDPKADNVPTWNYVAVHVSGEANVIQSPEKTFEALNALVEDNERRYGTGWQLKRNSDLETLSRGIVTFEVTGLSFQGKLKLSQKIEPHERENVISHLRERGDTQIAQWMELTRRS